MSDNTQKFIIAKALENLLLQDDPDGLNKMRNPNADVILLGMEWSNEEAQEALGRISCAIKEALTSQANLMQLEFQNAIGAFSEPTMPEMPHLPKMKSNVLDIFGDTRH